MMQDLVSIIITTKNEEKNIENCLKSIKLQTYSNIEIIVVDNNSSDQTKEISQKYTDKVLDKWPERSAQRNYGIIDIAKWKYTMFVDADMILAPRLVEDCVNFISQNNFVALWISEIVLGQNFWSQVRRFERTFYDGTVVDGVRFFDRAKFIEIWWFDATMSGPEDWDLDKKFKQIWKVWLLPQWEKIKDWELNSFVNERGVNPARYGSVIYHNESEFDLKKYLTKKWYYATSFDTYISKWWKDDEDIKRQLGMPYRFFGVFLEKGKWKKLLASPSLTFGMYFLRFMVGLKFLFRSKK